jgi:O-acetylhomoserine/O-acetylserine sulfhydrylase-like pyridoxal-dependent enzyme
MARRVKTDDSSPEPIKTTSLLSATTPEGRENELINMAYEEVAMRIQRHEATAAELVHFLKMGSEKERLERSKIEAEMELQRVKKTAIEEGRSMDLIVTEALEAFKRYNGVEDEEL